MAFWASMALVIIFLEGKLFQSGTSVFGLFTVLSLCLATMQAYFWILVQVTYQVVSQGFSLRVLYCVADTGYGLDRSMGGMQTCIAGSSKVPNG